MRLKAFNIHFYTNEIRTINSKSLESCRYEARITTISRSLQLFKVSSIRRLTKEGPVPLQTSYFLTSYPFPHNHDEGWKDALTFSKNSVFEIIGNTIESYLENVSES